MMGQEYSIVSLSCNEFSLSISHVENIHAGSYVCALNSPGTSLTDSVNVQIGSMFLDVTIVRNQVYVLINSLFLPLSPLPPPPSPSSQLLFQLLSNRLSRPQSVSGEASPSAVVESGTGLGISLRYFFGSFCERVLTNSVGLHRSTDVYRS